MFPNKEKFNT